MSISTFTTVVKRIGSDIHKLKKSSKNTGAAKFVKQNLFHCHYFWPWQY